MPTGLDWMDLPFYEAPSLGILPGSVQATVVLPANDATRVEEVLRKDRDVAAATQRSGRPGHRAAVTRLSRRVETAGHAVRGRSHLR